MPGKSESKKRGKPSMVLDTAGFRTVLESLPGSVFAHDLEGRLIFVNEVATRYTGYSKEELLGMTFSDIDPKSLQREDRTRLWHSLSEGESANIESVHLRKDNSTYPAEIHLNAIRLDGRPVILSVVFDITERKKAEEEYTSYLRFVESMDKVNRAMQGAFDIDQMLRDVMDVVLSIFDCDRVYLLYPCDPEASSWEVPMERTRSEYPGLYAAGKREIMEPDVRKVLQAALDAPGAVRFCPGSPNPTPSETWEKYGFRSQVAVDLHPKVGKPWLFGLHQCAFERVWTSEDEKLLEEVGRRLEDTISAMLIFRNLQDSEDRLSEAQRAAHLGHWECDLDAGTVTLSQEALRIYGLSDEEQTFKISSWHRRWLHLIHPEDREKMTRASAETKQGVPNEEIEFRILRPDGEVRIIQGFGAKKWDEPGRPRSIFGAIQDITERKQAEELVRNQEAFIRNILDSVDEGFAVIDRKYRIVSANRSYCKAVGIPETDLIGRLCHEASHHTERPCFESGEDCPVRRTFETGRPQVASHIHLDADGGKHNMELKTYPIADENGTVTSVIETSLDVTDKVKLEAQLQQAQKMESIGRLAGGVAHDFNNMLAVILGRTDMLINSLGTDHPEQESLREIRKATDRSIALTRQLLAFARKQTISPRTLDLNETVGGMLKMLQRLIGEDIDLLWRPWEGELKVRMDPSQIDQILANLCINARDAIEGVGRLTIETNTMILDEGYCRDHPGFVPGEYVLLMISDDGHGMDQETLCNIFEPFFTTKETGKGTGLGLATVYGIVKQNNGFIYVYSEPSYGTTFKIYLPRHSGGQAEAAVKEGPSSPVPRGAGTLLVVEDEIAMLEMTKMMLEELGYRVLAAPTPGDAIHMAEAFGDNIDLLMTDVVMPEMNGRQLADKLSPLYPEMKCLFMSGYTDNVIAHHGVLEEGAHFIQKPFSIHTLSEGVQEVLKGE